ncbi:hypothetical protein [Rubrivirga marina]|uniref:Uncharacterized protein n=1 Tax=Rubrivirga marina TaxID=1196024 RepID=A0A271IXF5_9BACT|nr:hypothetical protein [Rubrivirga marina]PAP75941.1 hypothetical protein BSZ37_05545 [Rubrivirga marina]
MFLRVVFALGSLTLIACADAQDAPAAVVADGRDVDAPPTDDAGALAEWATRPAVQAAVRAARAHWTAQDPGYEEEVRVLAVADGAFTRPGAEEHAVLYLMALWPRCCPKVGLGIVEGTPEVGGPGRLVRNVAFEGPTIGVTTVPDIDGDGLDELALRSAFGMGGDVEESVRLVSVGASGLIERPGASVYRSGCAAGRDGEEAVRIVATPGNPPTFTAETFARPGCEGGSWTPSAPPEPLPLDASPDTAAAVLPVD